MKAFDNLIIVAGTGRNSGKTTFVCRIIECFRDEGVISVKITPHFHSPSAGLISIADGKDFRIFRETATDGVKDSSRMRLAGAEVSYYIQATDSSVKNSFLELARRNLISSGPVVCESPALGLHIKAAILFLADSNEVLERRDGRALTSLSPVPVTPHDAEAVAGRISFSEGRWSLS